MKKPPGRHGGPLHELVYPARKAALTPDSPVEEPFEALSWRSAGIGGTDWRHSRGDETRAVRFTRHLDHVP